MDVPRRTDDRTTTHGRQARLIYRKDCRATSADIVIAHGSSLFVTDRGPHENILALDSLLHTLVRGLSIRHPWKMKMDQGSESSTEVDNTETEAYLDQTFVTINSAAVNSKGALR